RCRGEVVELGRTEALSRPLWYGERATPLSPLQCDRRARRAAALVGRFDQADHFQRVFRRDVTLAMRKRPQDRFEQAGIPTALAGGAVDGLTTFFAMDRQPELSVGVPQAVQRGDAPVRPGGGDEV